MDFTSQPDFSRSFKRFVKKYPGFAGDVDLLKRVIAACPEGNGTKHWNRLRESADHLAVVLKVRLACRAIKGESRFRVVYGFRTDIQRVDLIELYFKGEQTSETDKLLDEWLANQNLSSENS